MYNTMKKSSKSLKNSFKIEVEIGNNLENVLNSLSTSSQIVDALVSIFGSVSRNANKFNYEKTKKVLKK